MNLSETAQTMIDEINQAIASLPEQKRERCLLCAATLRKTVAVFHPVGWLALALVNLEAQLASAKKEEDSL